MTRLLPLLVVVTLLSPVSAQSPPPAPAAKNPPATQSPEPAALPLQFQTFTGDLGEMKKRRMIRAAVPYNRTHYFIDKGTQRGLAYESLKLFEDGLNKGITVPANQIHVVYMPMARDHMAAALLEGRVDLVAANLVVTPERQKVVDFTDPVRTGVNEIVVSGPGAAPISTKADLSGKEVYVRGGSIYHEHLSQLNERLKAQQLAPVIVKEAPAELEDDDILEMVNAGIVKYTVVDDLLAEFWVKVLPKLTAHPNIALSTGDTIAVAIRKNSPELLAEANKWIKANGPHSATANMLMRRYLVNTKFVKNATADAERKRFDSILSLFRKYGAQYSVDAILMAAQGYQESGLNQSAKSQVGAIGVMQVMPATGKDMKVGDITVMENNIHAGVKYIRFMIDQYFRDEPMSDLNKGLMAFASYNAGPARVRQLRAEAAKRGLDPNVWFGNVEQIASERIGRETVTYVSNIYKYYIAYRLALEEVEAKRRAQ